MLQYGAMLETDCSTFILVWLNILNSFGLGIMRPEPASGRLRGRVCDVVADLEAMCWQPARSGERKGGGVG